MYCYILPGGARNFAANMPRLPSLRTITQEYGVSHITAEKAVQSLRDADLVAAMMGVVEHS